MTDRAPTARPRIAVVHPQTLMRELLARTLQASGFDVSHQAAEPGSVDGADVVLVDESAMDASGAPIHGRAVVMLLGVADDLTVSRARDAGVTAFAMSSGPPSALADTIRRAVRSHARAASQRSS